MAHKGKCEFCGKVKMVEGNTIVCNYCIDCHRIVRFESLDSIKSIRQKISEEAVEAVVPMKKINYLM